MKASLAVSLLIPGSLFLCPPLEAAWPDGQSADLVLGQADFDTALTTTSASQVWNPKDVVVDPATANVFVSDRTNNRVLRFESLQSLMNGDAAVGVLGQPNFTQNNFGVSRSSMRTPLGLAIEPNGRLWVVDAGNHRVLRFDNPVVQADADGADGVLGQADFDSNTFSPNADDTMPGPDDVAVDSAGTLWVCNGSRILRFSNAAGKANGAAADGVLGQVNFTNSIPSSINGRVSNPEGLAVDSGGRLWVADTGNHRVLRFDDASNKSNGAVPDGILGQALFTTDDSGSDRNSFLDPSGLSVTPGGDLWVVDKGNHRLLLFSGAAAKPAGADADAVLGQPDFTTVAAGLSAGKLNSPFGVFAPSSGQVLVADDGNHRVLRFTMPPDLSGKRALLLKKIKKQKKLIKNAKRKKQVAKVKRLKKKLRRLRIQLRTL